jgi:hypothetical protein
LQKIDRLTPEQEASIIAKVKAKTTEDLRQKLFGGLFLRSSSYQKEVERSLYELNR